MNPIDITGKKFNFLTAIHFVEKKKTNQTKGLGKGINHFWLFKCDCGKTKIINKNSVTRGSVKSCGCLHIKNVIRKESGEASFTQIFHHYKRSAKIRNIEFSLNKEEFRLLTVKNCYYCGGVPSNCNKSKSCNGAYIYNGIDRVDNNLGYITNNAVSCCFKCNAAKSDMSQNEFLTWINTVYMYNKK